MTYQEYKQSIVPYMEFEYDIVSDDFMTRLTEINLPGERLLDTSKLNIMNHSFRKLFSDLYLNYPNIDSKLLKRVPILLDHYINGQLVKVFIFFPRNNAFSIYLLDISTIQNQQLDFKMMSIASESSNIVFGEIDKNDHLRIIAGKLKYLDTYDPNESLFVQLQKWVHPHDLIRLKQYNKKFKLRARMGDTYDLTIRLVDPKNHSDIRSYHIFGEVIELNPKTLQYDKILGVVTDITPYVQSQERLSLATDSTGVAIYEYDIRNELTYVNHSFYALFGVDPNILRNDLYLWLNGFDESSRFLLQDMIGKMFSGEKTDVQKLDLLYNHPSRGPIWVELSCNSIYTFNKNVPSQIVGTILDITKRKLNEEKLKMIAFYDDLTNIYRRHVLVDQIDNLIHEENQFAVLFLDLDRFKEINDNYGHDVGDRFLKAFVRLVKEILNPKHIFGRLAGDEFLIIVPNYDLEQVKDLKEQVRYQVSRLEIDDYKHNIGISIGCAFSFKDGETSSKLISVADKNMYIDKDKNGRK